MERKHKHIFNVTRSLIFQSNIPESCWSVVVIHDVHLINKVLAILRRKSLYEVFYNKLPKLCYLRVFGYLCFACTIERNISKLDQRVKTNVSSLDTKVAPKVI